MKGTSWFEHIDMLVFMIGIISFVGACILSLFNVTGIILIFMIAITLIFIFIILPIIVYLKISDIF